MSDVASLALLSDVLGVLPVLEAVLAEPDVRSADLVVVTGDHAAATSRRACGNPDRAAWAAEYVRSANSDADAVLAFGPATAATPALRRSTSELCVP